MSGSGDRIEVRCACGAVIRAPRMAAGKSTRCPSCGERIRVPSLSELAGEAIPPWQDDLPSGSTEPALPLTLAEAGGSSFGVDPNAVSSDGKIRFACACGARLKMPVSAAGRRAKCPKCGDGVSVPTPAPPIDNFGALFDALRDGERIVRDTPDEKAEH